MDKKKIEKIKKLVDSVGDEEFMVAIYGKGDEFHFGGYASGKEIAETFCAMLFDRFDCNGDGTEDFFIKGILKGICAYIENGGAGRIQVALPIIQSAARMIKDIRGVANAAKHEDCSICPKFEECDLPEADKFRKANGYDEKAN